MPLNAQQTQKVKEWLQNDGRPLACARCGKTDAWGSPELLALAAAAGKLELQFIVVACHCGYSVFIKRSALGGSP